MLKNMRKYLFAIKFDSIFMLSNKNNTDMNKKERIEYLKTHQSKIWLETRKQIFEELSNEQSMFCCCGKLATGLHEINCRKFNAKVDKVTLDRLKILK